MTKCCPTAMPRVTVVDIEIFLAATVTHVATWFNNCGQAQGLARWPLGGALEATRPPFHTLLRTHI